MADDLPSPQSSIQQKPDECDTDDDPSTSEFPSKSAAKSVNKLLFKIGAATEEGRCKVVQERYNAAFLENCKFFDGLIGSHGHSGRSTPQRDGSEMPPSPHGPEEDSRLQKKMSEARDTMNQAFCKSGLTDEKYVKVWETFQKGPAGMTYEEKIEIVSKIAQRLKRKTPRINSPKTTLVSTSYPLFG
ncbi:hypothetical protein BDR22DRAFT_886457 [Usnea florida]